MVEKEIMTAHVPETNTRVLETTFAELGVDTSSDNLGLASDRFTLGVKKVREDTIFVGRLKHPLAGGHFAQFLNSVSPFADQDVGGIINDIDLPILAERDYKAGKDKTTSKSIWLHERHLNDPRVGPPYIRFKDDHVDKWLKALKINSGLRVFERLQRIRFINNTEDLRKEFFSEDGHSRKSLKDSDVVGLISYFWVIPRYYHERFADFWTNNNLKGGERMRAFLDLLTTKTEQEKFAISYFNSARQILVDLETHRIIRDKVGGRGKGRIGNVKVKFDGNGKDVVVSNNTGTKVVISPTGQSGERSNWRVIEYQFPENYKKSSLYPIIAWKKDGNGTRTFLTQKEAMPYVAELGLPEGEQGDTKLGEITVASFARHIIRDWPAKMTLKRPEEFKLRGVRYLDDDHEFEQPMRGAQMPAWVAVEEHQAKLLKSETSVLARSEKHVGKSQPGRLSSLAT